MPVAEDRQAKALERIAHNMDAVIKILVTMNENMVSVGKTFNTWIEQEDTKDGVTHQLSVPLAEPDFPTTKESGYAYEAGSAEKWKEE